MSIIEKDLKVAVLSFKADDFQLMNIIGNRIMSDAVLLGNANQAVVGFFVKQVALSFLNLKPQIDDSEFLELKLIGEKYITSLSDVKEDTDQAQVWFDYHQFNLEIRRYPTTGLNKEMAAIYGEEPEITAKVRERLIEFLASNKTILFDDRNNFVKGLLSELQRVGLAFGYQVRDTVIFSCLLALDRFYDYFRIQHSSQTDELNSEAVKSMVYPFIERLVKLSSSTTLNYDEVNTLLWDLIKKWREFYIFYMEISPRVPSKQVELSKETKSKLSDVLGKALQKELKI
jgi:hypothetical protein